MIWQQNQIGEKCTLDHAVVGNRNQIGAETKILRGVIVSDDCQIGSHNQLAHGLRLWPNTVLQDQAISF